jgi:hypothetical protein
MLGDINAILALGPDKGEPSAREMNDWTARVPCDRTGGKSLRPHVLGCEHLFITLEQLWRRRFFFRSGVVAAGFSVLVDSEVGVVPLGTGDGSRGARMLGVV